MGAAMIGLHTFPDNPNWKGWWGDQPPFGTPVYVLPHTAPRPSIPMQGGTTFHSGSTRHRGRARRGDQGRWRPGRACRRWGQHRDEPMTIGRRLPHAGFTLTRDYPVLVERVWDAFAEEDQKRAWWGSGDAIEPGEWAFDFRVSGRDVAEGRFHDGPVSRYEATYTDIVEHVRIVSTYDMWLDGIHMSTSVASLEFEPIDEGTRFTHVEHGVCFDQF